MELSPQDKMNAMLQELELNTKKEALKQEKAHTTQAKIQSELFEQASKLNSQTEATQNVTTSLDIARSMHELEWVDESMRKQSVMLLKDAMKRARTAFK